MHHIIFTAAKQNAKHSPLLKSSWSCLHITFSYNITLYHSSLFFWHLDLKHTIYTRSQASELCIYTSFHMFYNIYVYTTIYIIIIDLLDWVKELQRSYTQWEIYRRFSDVLSKDKQKGGGNCATRKYWGHACAAS